MALDSAKLGWLSNLSVCLSILPLAFVDLVLPPTLDLFKSFIPG